MRRRSVLFAALAIATACGTRRPPVDSPVIPPSEVVDFSFLYARNCSGCHGPDGKGGAAIGLSDPIYLAVADNATVTRVTANGVPGTAMPAFARHSGGMLTDDQIDVIAKGIRSHWAKGNTLRDANPAAYAAQSPGDPARGTAVYDIYCASCHGAGGRGGTRASSIVDPSYLSLVSDQSLRTTVIVGRPELGAPDWRNDVPGKPMSPQEVSDVVAWLSSQRSKSPVQSKLEGEIR
jgi:cytochrome c oxidase cbb3-type subunit 3